MATDAMLDRGLEAGREEEADEESTLGTEKPFKAVGLTDDQMTILRFGNNTNITINLLASAYAATHHEWQWFLIFWTLALVPLLGLSWLTAYRDRKRAEQTSPGTRQLGSNDDLVEDESTNDNNFTDK